MNPGSLQQDMAAASEQLANVSTSISAAAQAIGRLGHAARDCLDAAKRNSDGTDTYCVPVEVLDALSVEVTRVGGAS